jgi:hypothetical protein
MQIGLGYFTAAMLPVPLQTCCCSLTLLLSKLLPMPLMQSGEASVGARRFHTLHIADLLLLLLAAG